jgi:glycosyltransferase involved in cell wall biosynthesis
MAARDAEATIYEAIASVLAQSERDWELLVVDDGSTDSTVDVTRDFADERIRLLQPGRIGVLGELRNLGIAESRGDWIALLDADDLWLPRKLERQLEAAGRAGLVHTDAVRLVDGQRQRVAVERPPAPLLEALVRNNFVYSSSVIVRRELLEQHGVFDPDPELYGSPDYELWLRLARHTEFAYVDEPLLAYRVHGGQMSADEARMIRGTIAALRKSAPRGRTLRRRLLRLRLQRLRARLRHR